MFILHLLFFYTKERDINGLTSATILPSIAQEGKDYIPLGSFTPGDNDRSEKENPLAVTNLR